MCLVQVTFIVLIEEQNEHLKIIDKNLIPQSNPTLEGAVIVW